VVAGLNLSEEFIALFNNLRKAAGDRPERVPVFYKRSGPSRPPSVVGGSGSTYAHLRLSEEDDRTILNFLKTLKYLIQRAPER